MDRLKEIVDVMAACRVDGVGNIDDNGSYICLLVSNDSGPPIKYRISEGVASLLAAELSALADQPKAANPESTIEEVAANAASLPPQSPLGATGEPVSPEDFVRSVDSQAAQLATLPNGWDGYGSPPPSAQTVNTVAAIVKDGSSNARVDLVPGSDGSVQAEWHLRGDIDVEYLIDAEGKHSLHVYRWPAPIDRPGADRAGWQPIETAPKDGTRVILDWGHKARVGYYLDNSKTSRPWQGWKVPSMEEWPAGQPVAWMPFPRLTSEGDASPTESILRDAGSSGSASSLSTKETR